MILLVRAADGRVNYVHVEQFGMYQQSWLTESTVEYKATFGTFSITVLEGDMVVATLDGQQPLEWSKVNDLHRFIFPDVGEPDTTTPALGVSVSENIRTTERFA